MANDLGGVGGVGGIGPHIPPEEGDDPNIEGDVNVLPEELMEVDDVVMDDVEGLIEGAEIPRAEVQEGGQRILHAAAGQDESVQGPDGQAALGGSIIGAVDDVVGGGMVEEPASRVIEAGGYRAEIRDWEDGRMEVDVMDPDGVEYSGGLDDSGHLMLSFSDDEGEWDFSFGDFEDDSFSIAVEERGGERREEIIEIDEDDEDIDEMTDDIERGERAFERLREEDQDKSPEEREQTWVDMLGIVCTVLENMQRWIEAHMGTGRPNI